MHRHHIMPRKLGGSNDRENIVEVTPEEHARIHHSQWILGGRWQDYYAWKGLSGQLGREELIREISRAANLGKPKPKSVEQKRKMSEAKLGRKFSEEHKRNISLGITGRVFTEETKAKISAAHIGKKLSQETKNKIGSAFRGKNKTQQS